MKNRDIIDGYFGFIGKYIVGPFVKNKGPKAGLGPILIIGLTVIPVLVVSFIILLTL